MATRILTAALIAHPCRLARVKSFLGHPAQPGGPDLPWLTLNQAVVEQDGWRYDRDPATLDLAALAQTKGDLLAATSRNHWPLALPMKDAERYPCNSCRWSRFATISGGHACDDHAAWTGTPPAEVQPGIRAMMQPDAG